MAGRQLVVQLMLALRQLRGECILSKEGNAYHHAARRCWPDWPVASTKMGQANMPGQSATIRALGDTDWDYHASSDWPHRRAAWL